VTGAEVEIGRQSVQYAGGFAARFRWAGSGRAEEVFGISEATGTLTDFGALGGEAVDSLCRADEPQGVLWDTHGLLLVKYGFRVYALNPRTGELAWSYASGTPALAVLASSRLDHVLLQTELETIALTSEGQVAWRAAHDDVITEAQLVAGRLDLTTYTGQHLYLDARSGQAA
jgi:outer membrane protein assembly factor BamB